MVLEKKNLKCIYLFLFIYLPRFANFWQGHRNGTCHQLLQGRTKQSLPQWEVDQTTGVYIPYSFWTEVWIMSPSNIFFYIIIQRKIIAVIYATYAVAKGKPEKNSGLYGIQTLDLCDTGAVLYQLS